MPAPTWFSKVTVRRIWSSTTISSRLNIQLLPSNSWKFLFAKSKREQVRPPDNYGLSILRGTSMGTSNYAARDQQGKVAFYVLLWKRKGISLELFDDYWRNVHGPVCARLPGQFQYWQLHVANNQ